MITNDSVKQSSTQTLLEKKMAQNVTHTVTHNVNEENQSSLCG